MGRGCWLLEVITSKEAGFCFGVKRAVNMAVNAVKDENRDSVYILGSIIHNPQVVDKLKTLGISSVDSLAEVEEGTLIIRSHGVHPDILQKAKDKNLEIIDTTCPYVKKAQDYVQKLVEENYQVFIFGDKNHPEVKGIYGFSNKQGHIIKNEQDLAKIDLEKRIGFVAQTTQSPEAYKNIISSVIDKTKELKIYNTICNTTQRRQNSAVVLANKVDLMFVIGGFNSA
ncbi:MAG: 4-hydroxy-3-methylbut-2-enyl diphosphate reductase, partial [Bacillota bacterium]